MKITFLGTGSAYRTPALGGHWGGCNPENPKNERLCQSILIEGGKTKIIIDTGPDIRQQTIRHNIKDIDAVLITHAHYDHFFGLPEMEVFSLLHKRSIPVYAHPSTWQGMIPAINWLLEERGNGNTILIRKDIAYHQEVKIGELSLVPFKQVHGSMDCTGFRLGDLAYSVDLKMLPEPSWEQLKGVKTWILECDSLKPTAMHNHLEQALEWISRLKPDQTFLTHIHPSLDHDDLLSYLPNRVAVAYDGMVINL